MNNEVKATRRQVLEFIRKKGIVSMQDLKAEFGYRHGGVWSLITRLRKGKLVEPIGRTAGMYGLTENGERRLEYYEQRGREG